jgi:hypothetical protein
MQQGEHRVHRPAVLGRVVLGAGTGPEDFERLIRPDLSLPSTPPRAGRETG